MKSFVLLCVVGLAAAITPFSRFHGPQYGAYPTYGQFGPFGHQQGFISSGSPSVNLPPHLQQGNPKREVLDTVFQWKILDFKFESPKQRQMYLDSGEFVPENNLPLGIDRWRDRLFITTPRWKLGSPASLSSISINDPAENPLLEPYPNINFHSTIANPDCAKLVSVYRTFIDECDRLWVIDAGVVETLTNFRQVCPPKIVIFDLVNNYPIFSYEIPPDQLKQDALHSSITVDVPNGRCENAFAYVTDVWRYGIVVFSFGDAKSWRTTSNLHFPDPKATDFNFNGLNFQWVDGTFGLSLAPADPNGNRIMFFRPMSSFNEFMVNTAVLKNESIWQNGGTSAKSFIPVGTRGKNGQSATVGISRDGVQVYTLVQRASIGCWDIRKPYTVANQGVVEADPVKINFPNDMKIDRAEPQHIWAISNNLPQFLYSTLDFSKINFRILTQSVAKAVEGTVCDPKVPASTHLSMADECNM